MRLAVISADGKSPLDPMTPKPALVIATIHIREREHWLRSTGCARDASAI